ncbi:hypothetical protein [Endozoicomonas atrinae]|uniref:hypothetical protein n=1 Tax=Endozoicomonas atrinae TaxID=1333660 RepID=UPI003B00F1CD
MDETTLLGDYYVQLILLQYAIGCVESDIASMQIRLRSCSLSELEIEDFEESIVTLKSVKRMLKLWSSALNNECPNPIPR